MSHREIRTWAPAIAAVALIGLVLALAGCGGSGHPRISSGASSPAATAAAEPGVDTYLCQGTTWDDLLQWRNSGGSLSGTFQEAQLSGQAPSEQVNSSSGRLTGTLNGSAITLSINSSQDLYGTLSGGQLSLNVPQQDGSIQAATCDQASLNDWNKAVASLNSQAGSDNQQANQAQAQASHDQGVSDAQQALAKDVKSLESDSGSWTITPRWRRTLRLCSPITGKSSRTIKLSNGHHAQTGR